jgi:hypothetical protein
MKRRQEDGLLAGPTIVADEGVQAGKAIAMTAKEYESSLY